MLVQEVEQREVKLSGGPLDEVRIVVDGDGQRIVIGYAVQNGRVFLKTTDREFDPSKPFSVHSAMYCEDGEEYKYCGVDQSDFEEKSNHINN
jgi:hypothetical protein